MAITVKIHDLDVSTRIVDCQVSMGEGEGNSSCTIELMDFDGKIENHLSSRTVAIKGIVGVPKPKTSPISLNITGGNGGVTGGSTGGSTGGTVSSGTVGTPTGYSVGANGTPSYPTPSSERDCILGIIKECLRQGIGDSAQIAYVLATVKHECGALGGGYYRPVTEIGGASKRYAPFHGRGLVQLTWRSNYEKYQRISGKPIVSQPNLVISDFGLSCFILVHGFKTGGFTGRKITDYIGGGRRDFIGARRCINGTDRASLIAGYASQWLGQLPSYMGSAKASPTVSTTSTPRQSANQPQKPATTATSPTTTRTPTPAPVATNTSTPSEPVPEGDKVDIVYEGKEYSFIYTGYSVKLNGLVSVTGAGARKAADNSDAAATSTADNQVSGKSGNQTTTAATTAKIPTTTKNANVKTIAQNVANSAGANLQFSGSSGATKPEVVKGNLKPSQLLAKEASEAGKTVTDTGKDLIVRDKASVNSHTLPVIIDVSRSDKPVQDLTLVSGSETTVKGFPTQVTVPMNLGLLAGDKVSSEYLLPANQDWVIDRVTHDFLSSSSQLDVYHPFEANPTLIQKPQTLALNIQLGSTGTTGTTGATNSGAVSGGAVAISGSVKSGTKAAQMVASANANRGQSSRSGPGGGNVACAWGINKWVLRPVFGRNFGDNPNLVVSVEADFKKSGWKSVAARDAFPGCIAIAVRIGSTAGHIGIVMRQQADPWVLSNSSSKAAFVSDYSWQNYLGRIYAPARFSYWAPPN